MAVVVPLEADVSTLGAGPSDVVPAPLPSPACLFERQQGHLRSPLDFVVGGKRFGTLAGEVTLERLEVDASRAYAIVDDGRVKLAAEVALASVRLGTRHPEPIDGWLELAAAKVVAASTGKLTVVPNLPSSFTPNEAVSVDRPCDALTPLAPSGEAPPSGDYVRLRAGRRVPLSAVPGGAPVGHLFRPPPPPRPAGSLLGAINDVDLFSLDLVRIDERGRHARVRVGGAGGRVVDGAEDRVVGWVPKDALEPKSAGLLGMLTDGTRQRGPLVRCERDVDLVVHVGGERHRVGRLHAEALVPVVAADARPIALRLSSSPLAALLDASRGDDPDATHVVIASEHTGSCHVTN